ncbi:MAG: radical SAM protein [Oscillospiraceae bacterium]|nr:radical SAM protein [Oscillospiraceae bacterium]
MRIGLVAVDGHSGFPNLALMRLSAWHKSQGDQVEWWNGLAHYDRVYLSKVFTFTPDVDTVINADEIVTGGTGYKDYGVLPPAVEAMPPDYSLYPNFSRAIGFMTRGCSRRCPWCLVPRKEGMIRPAATWEEIKRHDSREIVFLDNNVLASDFGLEQIDRMGGEPVWVDFNQGLDARLIIPEAARMLARLHWIRFIRFSCDTSDMVPVVEQAAAYLRDAGAAPSRFWAYVLVQNVEDAHRRVLALRDMGITPFAQPYWDYDGGEPTLRQKAFARWVNQKSIFKSCDWADYQYPGKEQT